MNVKFKYSVQHNLLFNLVCKIVLTPKLVDTHAIVYKHCINILFLLSITLEDIQTTRLCTTFKIKVLLTYYYCTSSQAKCLQ